MLRIPTDWQRIVCARTGRRKISKRSHRCRNRIEQEHRTASSLYSVELCLQMCDNIQSIEIIRDIPKDDQKKQAISSTGGTATAETDSLCRHHRAADKRSG